MEILQVAGLYPPHLGGAELVAESLATMQALRHNVTVYTSDVGARNAPRHERNGRLTVYRDRAWSVGNTPAIPRLLARLVRHRPVPDVVHVHMICAGVPELVRLASGLRGIPYVAHLHLMVRPSSGAGRALLPLYQRSLFGWFLRGAARVICLTSAMREHVIEEFGIDAARAVVVPNGVDLARFNPDTAPARDGSEVLFVGRLTDQKNVMTAVEAMAHLPQTTLRVVGSGELEGALQRRIADLRLSNVILEGRQPPEALARYYQRAAAVLMPSSHEGFPLVLLEAMAAGTPVVCSALPELVEAGGDAVVAVNSPTDRTLAAAVGALLDEPERRARLSHAASRRAARYTWPAVADAVDDVYTSMRQAAA